MLAGVAFFKSITSSGFMKKQESLELVFFPEAVMHRSPYESRFIISLWIFRASFKQSGVRTFPSDTASSKTVSSRTFSWKYCSALFKSLIASLSWGTKSLSVLFSALYRQKPMEQMPTVSRHRPIVSQGCVAMTRPVNAKILSRRRRYHLQNDTHRKHGPRRHSYEELGRRIS